MPFLLVRGTRCRLMTPDGKVIDPYTCRKHTTFTDDQTRRLGRRLLFEHDGFKLIVDANAPIPIGLSCADCGTMLVSPSLCKRCERMRGGR